MSLRIGENSWPGFQGLYGDIRHRLQFYKINNNFYNASTLERINELQSFRTA